MADPVSESVDSGTRKETNGGYNRSFWIQAARLKWRAAGFRMPGEQGFARTPTRN